MNASDGGGYGPRATYPVEQSSMSRRRWFALLTAAVVVLGVVLAVIGFQKFGNPDVSGETTGFFLTGPDTVDVQFTVDRADPSTPVACVVKARSKDGAEVGRREVLIVGGNAQRVGVRTTIHTSAQPVIGEVFGCDPNVPPYLTRTDKP